MKARVQIEEAGTRLSLQEARRIEEVTDRASAQQQFRVRLPMALMSEDTLERLEKLFAGAPGMSQVVFGLASQDGTVAGVPSQRPVKASPALTEARRGQQ